MKLPITEAFKLVLIKYYTQMALHKQMDETEAISVQISSFLFLALSMFEQKSIETVPDTKWMINTLQSYLSRYTTIEYSTKWKELSSQILLTRVREDSDEKLFLRLRVDEDLPIYRMIEKNLMLPVKFMKGLKSNNVSLSEDYGFEISFEGMEESEVLTSLVAVLHNAYNRSFYFPGLVSSSNLTTVDLYGSSKNELLNPFNEPTFSARGDIIMDVRQLTPDVVFKLVQWIRSVVDSNRQIILISNRNNVSSLNTKIHTGLTVESYVVL